MMRCMAKVWMRTCVFIACGLRSVHDARTRWTLLAPSVGWGWQGLLCTVLCGLEDVSKFTGICHSRRCLTHSVRCHCHALYDHPERNVLKILKIANKDILRTDGKTDVLMTGVALSQKNNDKWSYLPQLKKMRFFLFYFVLWGFLAVFFLAFGVFFICLKSVFCFWSDVSYLLIKRRRTEPLCCTITLAQSFLITEAPIPVKHFSST